MKIETKSLYNMDNTLITYEAGEEIIKIKTPSHDEAFGIIVKNSSGEDATLIIKGGNSVMAAGDCAISLKNGEDTLVNLKDTGRFKNVHGEDAGYIVLEVSGTSADNISFFPFCL